MELGSILEFVENKSILVIGAAGFLAKIFVEKVLRTQPNVKKLYLLLRAADNKIANQRLHTEIIERDLFRVLKQKMGLNFSSFISEKVTMVPGDITFEGMGIKDPKLMEDMMKEIDEIVNFAAAVNFDERYDVSLYLNTFGAKRVLDFAKGCINLKSLVHVSTAFVAGGRTGLILENPYHLGDTLNGTPGLDIDVEKKLVEEKLQKLQTEGASYEVVTLSMKDMGMERARVYGWPNVYVFTKALGEMLMIHHKEDTPLVIIRPTIITSTFKEPFPGWVEGLRTIDSIVAPYGKGRLHCFLADPNGLFDAIPADMVVNAIMVAMVAHANKRFSEEKMMIYNVGSSLRNPVRFTTLQETAYTYFSKHPWVNEDGKQVIVHPLKLITSMASFKRYLTFRYLLPLKGLQIVNIILCQSFKSTYMEMNRKISLVLRLVDLYRPYVLFKGVFDDTNTEKLRLAARENKVETDVFYFEPKAIDWDDYFMNTHMPGIVRHVMNRSTSR